MAAAGTSILGFANRLYGGDRHSKVGPGPASLEGWRRWGWGATEPGTMFSFLKKCSGCLGWISRLLFTEFAATSRTATMPIHVSSSTGVCLCACVFYLSV